MKKLFLIRNPLLFQGEKHLKKKKNYFEGWYFKTTNNKETIAFIPGISITNDKKEAFIQVITNNSSYYINYDIKDFSFNHTPFYIKVGNNFFSQEKIHIDINDDNQNLKVYGDIKYTKHENINTNFMNPNIMGPFSYIPFMECNHAIISMKNKANGFVIINNAKIKFKNSTGYIEKDWGTSFPKTYLWCQGNSFKETNTSFMISIANIPFKIFEFQGLICSLIIDDKEYRFATYNNTKLLEYDINNTNNTLNITLRKGHHYLNITSNYQEGLKLIAPIKGEMTKNIFESINEKVTVTLKKDNIILFKDTSNCALEIVKNET